MRALDELIRKYELDRPKRSMEDEETESYRITADEIRDIYKQEARKLSAGDKTQIVVQRIYQQYKGFSVIDEIRDMKIDGVSGGVSGIPPSMWEANGAWRKKRSCARCQGRMTACGCFIKGNLSI